MRHDHEAMGAAAGGGCIVILRNEGGDGLGEFLAERRPVRGRPEPDLGIHRQGRQTFAGRLRLMDELTAIRPLLI